MANVESLAALDRIVSKIYLLKNNLLSSGHCVESIAYEVVYGASLYIYFSGEKTYDRDGNNAFDCFEAGSYRITIEDDR